MKAVTSVHTIDRTRTGYRRGVLAAASQGVPGLRSLFSSVTSIAARFQNGIARRALRLRRNDLRAVPKPPSRIDECANAFNSILERLTGAPTSFAQSRPPLTLSSPNETAEC